MCKGPKVQASKVNSSNRKKFSEAGMEWIFKKVVSDEVVKRKQGSGRVFKSD